MPCSCWLVNPKITPPTGGGGEGKRSAALNPCEEGRDLARVAKTKTRPAALESAVRGSGSQTPSAEPGAAILRAAARPEGVSAVPAE